MIGMMMMTFILFFAFVVNVGMLVNAKINLQNAADLAAYAGAAVQARHLNHISYLNYEMRRQYKKFLFRYYVLGNLAQDSHPMSSGVSGPRVWSPDGQVAGYGVPATCIIFNSADNYCHLSKLPSITIPKGSPIDAVQTTLIDQLKQLEGKRQEGCDSASAINEQTNLLWLWNTDHDLSNLEQSLNSQGPKQKSYIPVLKGVAGGLGVIPKEILLSQRVKVLAQHYVNAAPETGVNFETASQMKSQPNPAVKERTIQAFLSAYNTLGSGTFDNVESIRMDELLPGTGSAANLIKLNEIKTGFDTYAIKFKFVPKGNTLDPNNPEKDCEPEALPMYISTPITVGFTKDPKILTYYAIRLTAKAKLLFNPFGSEITLKAYSAAQPFGSRIGPPLTQNDFTSAAQFNGNASGGTLGMQGANNRIPNLPILDNEGAPQSSTGWGKNDVIGTFYEQLSQGNKNQILTPDSVEHALYAAMVPNPFESGKYNIPSDLNADPFVQHFAGPNGGYYKFWAPLISPNSQSPSDAKQEFADVIAKLFIAPSSNNTSASTSTLQMDPAFVAAFTASFDQYLDALRAGNGEDGEGLHVASIRNPYTTPKGEVTLSKANFMLKDAAKVKTSWSKVKDGSFAERGRTGYSVKFVSFDSLLNGKVKTDGATTADNTPLSDADSDNDFPKLQH